MSKGLIIPHFEEVEILLTLKCNLNCKHCYIQGPKWRRETIIKNEIDFSELNSFQILLERTKTVHITGGEPFLELDKLLSLLNVISMHELTTSITTNAILINSSVLEKLSKYQKNCSSIRVSLDGFYPETHDFLRGKGTHKHTLLGIKKLIQAGFIVTLFTAMHSKLNEREIHLLKNFCKKAGLAIFFYPLIEIGNAIRNPEIFPKKSAFPSYTEKTLKPSEKKTECIYRVGNDFITIFPDGVIGRCRFDYNESFSLKKIESINNYFQKETNIISECILKDACPLSKKCTFCPVYSQWYFSDYRIPNPSCLRKLME